MRPSLFPHVEYFVLSAITLEWSEVEAVLEWSGAEAQLEWSKVEAALDWSEAEAVHTGPESRFLTNNSFSVIFWPILMPNTANWGFSGSSSLFLTNKY